MEPEIHNAADISKIMDGGFDGDDGKVIDWFEGVAENAGRVQTETLCRILKLNYGAEYLRKWLGDVNVEDMDGCALETLYTSLVPLANHADLESYIQRIAHGDKSPLLTQQPITTLSLRYYYIYRSAVSVLIKFLKLHQLINKYLVIY